ncbi:MAG: 30S ribosomal protein S18 [Patescibacteria group bacterium]
MPTIKKLHTLLPKPKYCHFCVNGLEVADYKDPQIFQRFISSYAKILPRRRPGTCSKHQRQLAQAIKRARTMALLPFTTR